MKYLDDKKQINYNLMNNHLWIIWTTGHEAFFPIAQRIKTKGIDFSNIRFNFFMDKALL